MIKKLSILFLFIPLLLSGSGTQKISKKQNVLKVVTQIDIACCHNGKTLSRRYTDPRKIEPFLDYLRLLKYQGKAESDPEKLIGDIYEITLQYATGENHIYRQRSNLYLSKDNHPWEKVDPEHAKYLYSLLLLVPGDN